MKVGLFAYINTLLGRALSSAKIQDCVFKVLKNPENKLDDYFEKIKQIQVKGNQRYKGKIVETHKRFIQKMKQHKSLPNLAKHSKQISEDQEELLKLQEIVQEIAKYDKFEKEQIVESPNIQVIGRVSSDMNNDYSASMFNNLPLVKKQDNIDPSKSNNIIT